ncbi:uncharacterized protein A4U43_C07F28890 [Asparagus officinalis]|uniref:PB1 domain-containing protein n=1 Tax=Asparagus officinalis TaxID=4686 RepID=A0A5P1EFR2_ASPOF|nr:uncharacterized protein A4U43_C07F28890 [Asparagus officinalis]
MGGEEKVKLLCTFGGELVREQGKPFYLGGKTRLVSIDRSSSFRSLISKMAEVSDGDSSSVDVRYQLPDGSLDHRLISVENDDDVRNMIEEFDPNRKISIFLFNRRGSYSDNDDYDYEIAIQEEADDNLHALDSIAANCVREASIS